MEIVQLSGDPLIQDSLKRRLNPKIKEVVRKEILKLLEAGIIYPVADSQWVSHVHCVPKKGGITVVPNEKNELIPQRIINGYRMVIDFRKLNKATKKIITPYLLSIKLFMPLQDMTHCVSSTHIPDTIKLK